MRCEWRYYGGPMAYLYLAGHYITEQGHHRAFAYSLYRHSLSEAVTRAVALRSQHGYPVTPVSDVVKSLTPHYLMVSQQGPPAVLRNPRQRRRPRITR